MIYGTAWKEDATATLVKKAVAAGFRGIDTANQRKHYCEADVGQVLLELQSEGIDRDDLFLQSKYTYQAGQDHRLPYDPKDDFDTQVKASFASSLEHLHTDYLDSYLLHGPSAYHTLTDADWQVWGAMETLAQSGQTKIIGVSNVGLHHLKELCEKAKVKPKMVQNRCFAAQGWDQEVREYCLAHQITYQGFSLLTANPGILVHDEIARIAAALKATPAQVIFRFAAQMGIVPLTGTTSREHMQQDLASLELPLGDEDVKVIFNLSSAVR